MAKRYYVPFPEQGGGSYMPMPRHVLRIGDAERDAAAADLGEHYAAGRLNLDELHERLGGVFAAKTHGQLSKIMADLPSTRRPEPAWSAADELLADEPRQIDGRKHDTPSDRAGRIAAVSLLILAMLLWLFTALLFTRHGYYPSHPGPWGGPGTGPWGGGH